MVFVQSNFGTGNIFVKVYAPKAAIEGNKNNILN